MALLNLFYRNDWKKKIFRIISTDHTNLSRSWDKVEKSMRDRYIIESILLKQKNTKIKHKKRNGML